MEYDQFCSKAKVKYLIRFECGMVIKFTDNTVVLDMEYYQFCSKAIVKSLIRFEREMVINFTDNTTVLDMEYYQFCFMGWIGWDWEIK